MVLFFFSEWYWKCVFYGYFQRLLAVLAAILSVVVVWSEVTFFNKQPVLSIFAIIVNVAKVKYDYFTIEVGINYSNHSMKYFVNLRRFSVTFNCCYFIFMLLCLFYCFKNKSPKLILLSTTSSNQ